MSLGISGPKTQTTESNDFLSQLFNQATKSSEASTSTGTQAQTGTQAGVTESTTGRNLTPYQEATQPQLFKVISQMMTDPRAFLAPQQNQAREQVNQDYGGLSDSLRQQFLSGSGGGGTGKYGKAVVQGELARRGGLAQVDNSFASQAAQLPVTAAQLAQNFLGLNFGETSKGSTTGTTSNVGTSTGTTTSTGDTSTVGGSQQTKVGSEKQHQGWGFSGGF